MTSESTSHSSALSGGPFPRPFGPYALLGTFGRGGMGEVYLARKEGIAGIEKICVLKLLRGDLANEKEYVGRFLDEARVVVALQHANICPVFDVGQHEDVLFIAMEYIPGVNVRGVIDRLHELDEKMPPDVAVFLGTQILSALDYAHHHEDPVTGAPLHVVHRDVSPHNVMVTFQGAVKLIDFGLAASSVKKEETESQIVMGKVAYMSPEQARGEDVDARTDQFAAAILITELLTGQRFYGTMKTHEIWQVVGPGGYLPAGFDAIDAAVGAALRRALAARAEDRFPSCDALREALLSTTLLAHPSRAERALKELMQRRFAEDNERQRQMATRYANVPTSVISDAHERTMSSGAAPSASATPSHGSSSTSARQDTPAAREPTPSSGTSRSRPRVTDELDHGTTEATVSSTKILAPTKPERNLPVGYAALVAGALALGYFAALYGMGGSDTPLTTTVRVERAEARAVEGLAPPDARGAPDAPPTPTTPPPETPTATTIATASEDAGADEEAAPVEAAADDAEVVDDASDAPEHVGRPRHGGKHRRTSGIGARAPSPETAPTTSAAVDAPPPSEAPVPPPAPVTTTTPPTPPPAPPAAAPPLSLDALHARLERCPEKCAKDIVARFKMSDMADAKVADAFRRTGTNCLRHCPSTP